MDSPSSHRRARKLRRTGRHTAPSQVEKVAATAAKAAPAVAIAGVLVSSVPAHAATTAAAAGTAVSAQAHHDTHHQAATRTYTVEPGDTLSGIALRFYGKTADWTWIYDDNRSVVQNPDTIYAGEVLKVPDTRTTTSTTSATSTSYTPQHAKGTVLTSASSLSGTLGCSQLETLWEAAGGSQAEAFTAAEIAMAESGGNQYATGTVGERGYWQINPDHGSLSTYDPMGNAQAAVIISDNGTDWTPWTTYTSGDYIGRC
ncbi:MAG TPA: LysM peptidoglycan-binding domain-containing protein [Streptosporangiaceae bacterium]|nr:LysM peptidoglycan-binding domain-containing protein [Streptosporangiaceae bacterium]